MALTSKSILQRYGKERRFDESGLVHNRNGPITFILSPLTGIPGTGTSFYRRLRTPAHRFGPKMNQAKDNSLLSRLLTVRFNDANVSMKPTRYPRTTTFFAGLGSNCSEQSDPRIPESNMVHIIWKFYFTFQLTKIGDLSELTNLVKLYVRNNQINNISNISTAPQEMLILSTKLSPIPQHQTTDRHQ